MFNVLEIVLEIYCLQYIQFNMHFKCRPCYVILWQLLWAIHDAELCDETFILRLKKYFPYCKIVRIYSAIEQMKVIQHMIAMICSKYSTIARLIALHNVLYRGSTEYWLLL